MNKVYRKMLEFKDECQAMNLDKSKPKLPCLNCKKIKQHNNCFCSAECCKEYDLKKKGK